VVGVQERGMLTAATSSQRLLVAMAAPTNQALFEAHHFGAGGLVVVVVEPFDDLECPAALQDIPAHDMVPERRRLFSVTGGSQPLRALLEQEISPPDQLVEGVEMTAGSFDVFQCLRRFADRVDGVRLTARIVDGYYTSGGTQERAR
jgi:hypothetical protein